MKFLKYLFPILFCITSAFAEPGGDLNLSNKASLVSRDGFNLNLGTEGDDDVVVIQNNTTTMSIDGATGLVSFPVGFGGNIIGTGNVTVQVDSDTDRLFTFGAEGDDDVWLAGLDSDTGSGSFAIHTNTADADDDQALILCGGGGPGFACAADGRGSWFQIEGKEYGGRLFLHTSDTSGADMFFGSSDDFIFEGLDGTDRMVVDSTGVLIPNAIYYKGKNAAGDADISLLGTTSNNDTVIGTYTGRKLSIRPELDANRQFIFAASSDTEHTFTYGDGGATAAQTLVISSSTTDADDDSTVYICGGGALGTSGDRGACISVEGNEKSGGADIRFETGSAAGSAYEFITAGTTRMTLTNGTLESGTAGGTSIGSATLPFSNFIAGNGTINTQMAYSNGDSAGTIGTTTNHPLEVRVSGTEVCRFASGGKLTCTGTGDFGWSVQSAANTACTTTCTAPAVYGYDSGTNLPVGPSDATADVCLCAGAS